MAGALRRKLWRTTRRRGYDPRRARAYVSAALQEIEARQNRRARKAAS